MNVPISIDFEEFTDRLNHEICQALELPPREMNFQNLCEKIAATINDHTSGATSELSENATRWLAVAENEAKELRGLTQQIDILKDLFKVNSEGILSEFDNERLFMMGLRDGERAFSHDLETQIQSLRLKETELNTRATHQKQEMGHVQRIMKQRDEKLQVEEIEGIDSIKGKGVRQRLMNEIERVRDMAERSQRGDLDGLFDETEMLIKEEEEAERYEIAELESLRRMMAGKKRGGSRNSVVRDSTGDRSSVMAEARMKVEQLRRQRLERDSTSRFA
jgi:hypothetical protein